jgi:hypothetical protein
VRSCVPSIRVLQRRIRSRRWAPNFSSLT